MAVLCELKIPKSKIVNHPMPTAEEVLLSKELMPTTLSAAQLELLETAITERSLFAAGCNDVRIVQSIRDGARKILRGEWSQEEARRFLQSCLEYFNYTPEPGTEGTIQDLGSTPRKNLILDTNVAQCQNYAWRQSLLADDRKQAWELRRVGTRLEPRKWDILWNEAYAELTPEERLTVDPNRHVALIASPIWTKLSRFGTPYPPFDYNSGMGVAVVPWTGADIALPDSNEGLNDNLTASVKGVDDDLRQWIEDRMEISISFNGDTATFKGRKMT